MSNEKRVTRPFDARRWRVGSYQPPVEIRASRVVPTPNPFIILPSEIKPAEAAQTVWNAYKSSPNTAGKAAYVHCVQPDTRMDLVVSRPQLFQTDVRLGNMQTDGFLRPIIDPSLPDQDNLRRLKEQISELQRLQRQGVIEIKGFHVAVDKTTE